MRFGAICVAASFAMLATGCGGGGSTPPVSHGGVPSNPQAISAVAKLVIPNPAPAAHLKPHYVSASTNGVQVVTYAHADSGHTTPLATVVTDVSAGSSACTSGPGGRTCNVGVQGPAGNDDFVFSLYDTAPAGGTIPSTAHLLGTAGVTQTLVANTANTVTATIGGVIAGLSGQSPFTSVPADGSTHVVGLTISATDFGNNTINGTNGTFANPITVAVTEHGGSGHALVQLNGGTGAASVQVTKASDTVQVSYDGKGSPGYYMTVSLTAAPVNGQGGASESATVSPLILSSTNADYTQASSSLGLKGNGDLAPFTVSEAQASSPTFTFTRGTHCPATALLETLSNTTFNVLALGNKSTYAPATGCAMTVSDGTSTVTLGVSNTYSATFVTPTVSEFPVPTSNSAPTQITVGGDGDLWFSEPQGSGKLAKIPTNATPGSGAQIVEYQVPLTYGTPGPFGVGVGSDGNVWWTDCLTDAIGKMTTSGSATQYVSNAASTGSIVAGPDGSMWFSECATPYDVGKSTLSGTFSYYTPTSTGISAGITEGPDGNLWMTETSYDKIARITPSGTITEFSTPTIASAPKSIVAGPDGNLWFTECGASQIGSITPSGAITEYPTLTTNAAPTGITVGADGALWFTEQGADQIGRITTAGAVSEYAVPTSASSPYGITSGPDGAIWFTEFTGNNIGKLVL